MKTRKYLIGLFGLALLVAIGCASATFVRDSYRGLMVSAATYETTMESVADLCKQGLITNEQKDKIVFIAGHYYVAYHSAVDALVTYEKSKTLEDKEKLVLTINSVSKTLAELLEYIKPYIVEVK